MVTKIYRRDLGLESLIMLVLQKIFLPYFGPGEISVIDAFHSGKVRSDHPSQSRSTASEIGGRPRGLDDAISPMDLMIVVVVEGSCGGSVEGSCGGCSVGAVAVIAAVVAVDFCSCCCC